MHVMNMMSKTTSVLLATAFICAHASSSSSSVSSSERLLDTGILRSLGNTVGFQLPFSSRNAGFANTQVNRLPLVSSTVNRRVTTPLMMETKERTTDDIINGDAINGANATTAEGVSSEGNDLIDFFERIFQQSYDAADATNRSQNAVNGDSPLTSDIQRSIESLSAGASEKNVPDILDLTVDFANEVYNKQKGVNGNGGDGDSSEAFNFDQLQSSFSEDLPTEITNSITELFRQLEVALDERFVEVCEEIAFYDVEGLRSDKDVKPGPKRLLEEDYERMRREREAERIKRRKARSQSLGKMRKDAVRQTLGKSESNTTSPIDAVIVSSSTDEVNGMSYMEDIAQTSKRMRTADIMRNFNVAPIYYTIALCMRWVEKASVPPMATLMFLRGLAYPLKWREGKSGGRARARMRLFGRKKGPAVTAANGRIKTFGDEEVADEEFILGWKRTGEIAAKGKRGRAWATFRRSAEIWFYFSSFYIKDTWILKNYDSGRWSEDRFKEERGKLGAQLTQNLLKLGPTFIKVLA